MKSILDPTFRYIPAANTDIAATFRRIRREQAAERKRAELTAAKVKPIRRERAA